jgi:anti-anti-sigma regulatory factor
VLRCSGEEDIATQSLRRAPLTRAGRAPDGLVVDLSELAFADSSLMIDLAMLARRLRLRGAIMRIRGARPPIRSVIERVGLHRLPSVCVEGPAPATA